MGRAVAGVLAVLVVLGAAGAAAAPPATWAVLPLQARGVDSAAVDTVASLLRSEIGHRAGARIVAVAQPDCLDVGCAVVSGRAAGASVVVWGEVSALGSKYIVTLSAADTGATPGTTLHRDAAERIEDLDAVIARLAQAIAGRARRAAAPNPYRRVDRAVVARPAPAYAPPAPVQAPAARTYAPGPAPLPPPPPRAAETATARPLETVMRPVRGVLGGAFRIGALIPIGQSYAGNPGGAGLALDLSYWFESDSFAIEARAGVRFDVAEGPASYAEVPLDCGMFWLLSRGDAVPFFGGGLGYRYLWEKQARTITTGAVLPATTNVIKEGEGSAPGMYLRAGLLLGRTHSGRIALAAEYSVIFATINGYRAPQAMTFGTTVIF